MLTLKTALRAMIPAGKESLSIARLVVIESAGRSKNAGALYSFHTAGGSRRGTIRASGLLQHSLGVLSWQGQVPLYSLPCISYKERGLRLGEVHGSHHKAVTSCLPVPSRCSAAHQPCAPHRRDEHFRFGAVSSLTLLC